MGTFATIITINYLGKSLIGPLTKKRIQLFNYV